MLWFWADSFEKLGLNQAAWKGFEQLRRKKVDWTVSTSWSIGKICHLGNPLSPQYRAQNNAGQRHAEAGSADLQSRMDFGSVDGPLNNGEQR